ncbi:laccase domain-containing protein, partial [Streptomyces sp. NPDC059802]|uniref:laccase domain-containing protein n=1 Tax=Streptomyces sp. NPDC059802 TaxID=3346952 RepID=UPI00366799CF
MIAQLHARSSAGGAHFSFTDRWGGVSAAPYEELNLGGAVGDDPAPVLAQSERAPPGRGLDPARGVWFNHGHRRGGAGGVRA